MIERLDEVMRRLAGNTVLDASARGDLAAELAQVRADVRELELRERVYRDVVRDRNREFEEKVLELSVLKETGDIVAASFGVDNLLPRILDLIGRELATTCCSIMQLDPTTGELRTTAGRAADGTRPVQDGPHPELRAGEGIAGWVATSREALIVSDVSRDVRFKRVDGGPPPRGSLCCLPLLAEDRVLGVFNLSSASVGHFGAAHVRILRLVASQIASALLGREAVVELRGLRDRLEEQVRQRTEQLEERTEDLRRKNDTITDLYFSLEEAQRELEERNREIVRALAFNDNIVETVNVGIGVVDHERRVVTWNRAMEHITGGCLPKEEVLGRRLEDLPPDLSERFGLGRPLLDALTNGRPSSRHNHVVEMPGGEEVHLNLHHLPVSIGGDGEGQVIIVMENITNNVALADERVRAERLAAITATMVSVNHEVNNPLAVILGYSQMLLERLDSGPADERALARVRKDLAMIEGEALRIRDITAKLAALIEPVVTSYPAADGMPMVDLAASRVAGGAAARPATPSPGPASLPPTPDAGPSAEPSPRVPQADPGVRNG